MRCDLSGSGSSGSSSFDMTPIIDVVFLLIIFFMLVCQFIVAENFEVEVPQNVIMAQEVPVKQELMTTVTVMEEADERVWYAVGSECFALEDPERISDLIAGQIDIQLQPLKSERRIVSLRADKDLTFGQVRCALEGISRSSAEEIHWAVIKKEE